MKYFAMKMNDVSAKIAWLMERSVEPLHPSVSQVKMHERYSMVSPLFLT